MSPRGLASYVLMAALAALAGAGGMLLLRARPALDAVTTHGEWVTIPHGPAAIRAYAAWPERPDPAPAVIVIHENQGLTDWEPTVADRLAASGFVALAVDMLSSRFGRTPAPGDSARRLIGELRPEDITADLDAAFDWLNAQDAVRRDQIGVIGFCWGGGNSFRYATRNPRLRAAVVCYGPAPDSAAMGRIEAAVLGVYGKNDARINAALPNVERWMAAHGKRFAHDIYPGTGHGFLKPGRQGHDSDQPARAWERIVGFFRAELGR
jgi:carboxymethylenebutenolidase